MCCLVNKSKRHGCLQGTLLFLLVISFLMFGLILFIHLGVYYLTTAAQPNELLVGREQRSEPLIGSGGSIIEQARKKRQNDLEQLGMEEESMAKKLSQIFFTRECPLNRWIVKSAILLDLCGPGIESGSEVVPIYDSMTNLQFKTCLRNSFFYIGWSSLLPTVLLLFSLISVCRLWLCPMISIALIYLGLTITLIISLVLYKSGSILTDDWPLFLAMILLICLYSLLGLLLLLLFSLRTCEERKLRRSDHASDSGSGQKKKLMKKLNNHHDLDLVDGDLEDMMVVDDDPNVPLYNNNGQLHSSAPNNNKKRNTDFDDKIKDFKYIDDDMSYVFRRG